MFGSGPNRRYVGVPGQAPGSIEAQTALPGGMSGVLTSKFYANLLGRWLTNDTYPLRQGMGEVMQNLDSQQSSGPRRRATAATHRRPATAGRHPPPTTGGSAAKKKKKKNAGN